MKDHPRCVDGWSLALFNAHDGDLAHFGPALRFDPRYGDDMAEIYGQSLGESTGDG